MSALARGESRLCPSSILRPILPVEMGLLSPFIEPYSRWFVSGGFIPFANSLCIGLFERGASEHTESGQTNIPRGLERTYRERESGLGMFVLVTYVR